MVYTNTNFNHHIDIRKPEMNVLSSNIGFVNEPQQQHQLESSSTSSRERRQSTSGRKRNQRHSNSLTRQANSAEDGNKRSRTRSTDLNNHKENENPNLNHKRRSSHSKNCSKAITTITTLKIGEDGRPLTVTSEIKHNSNQLERQEQTSQIKPNSQKMELSFVSLTQTRVKNRKKRESRPSREFLQRSVDESLSTEDSEIFWNGDALIEEANNGGAVAPNLHIMTPIIEVPTPSHNNVNNRIYSNFNSSGKRNGANNGVTPLANKVLQANFKSLSGSSIPLSKKYKRAHVFKVILIFRIYQVRQMCSGT